MKKEKIYEEAQKFLENIFSELSVDIEEMELDHLCYRTSTGLEYEELRIIFSSFSELLIESEIGGRLISTYKLETPIIFKDHKISIIELPAPKLNKKFINGFEHAEFVTDMSFKDMITFYHYLEFDTSALNKEYNPELKLKLLDGKQVKFHHQSLEDVITKEKKENIK